MADLNRNDIEDGKRIADIFATLSEENKNMAIVYLSALFNVSLHWHIVACTRLHQISIFSHPLE